MDDRGDFDGTSVDISPKEYGEGSIFFWVWVNWYATYKRVAYTANGMDRQEQFFLREYKTE